MRNPLKEQTMKQTSPVYQNCKFEKKEIKMLKELRKTIDRNVDHCNKELETIKRSQSKLDNSTAEVKTELKTMNSRLNNAEE